MVFEKQNGKVVVHLGPKHQAYPEEIIRQRRGHNGLAEYLIRWNILSSENGTGRSPSTSLTESKMENILMWMSADDVYANCPVLLGKREPKEQWVEEASSCLPPDVTLDEASILEMKVDVRNLVERAAWQMASTAVPRSSILNTIHVLSVYASIGALVDVFKETGALDLLMKMLCHEEQLIRRSAGKMLRALASHNAGSRAYVLLSLSQQEDIEQHMDFDSRYTLLELFAETTSSEEHAMSFEGLPLPQIPGKQLFSLVKRYLWATSLKDELNATGEPGRDYQPSRSPRANSGGKTKLQCEFDFSMALAHLLSELVQIMGWNGNQDYPLLKVRQPRVVQSIFQPPIPLCDPIPRAAQPPQEESSPFKQRSAFSSRSSYVEYVQEKVVRGTRVRMLQDYEKVCAGDEGEFLQSNNGTPPVQVYWESLGRMYWVHWDMIEIVGTPRHAYQKAQEKLFSLTETQRQDIVSQVAYCQPLRGLYSLPYLTDQQNGNSGTLSRAEWWELLFFVKKLELHKQQELVEFIQQNQKLSELDEEGLFQMSVSVELAQQVLQLLSKHGQDCMQRDLQSSHVYLKYSFSKGRTEQNIQKSDRMPENRDGLLNVMVSQKPEKKPLSAEGPSPSPSLREKTDMQLVHELLRLEGLSFPPTLDEKAKAFCSVKVAGKKSTLEQLADAMEMIQKSYSDIELQMAGLRFITRILEKDHEQERLAVKAVEELAIRENMVEMLVELLNHRLRENLLMVLALQLLYALLAKHDWRVFFATKGGLHSVLSCMQHHPMSASVQQAGLAVLKILLAAGNCELSGNCSKHYPLDRSSAQVMQKILTTIGSASENLLSAVPAALQKMMNTPGASSGVQNGLLVLNKLMEHHQGLAEQLGPGGLHSLLRSCCHSEHASHEMLAQIALRRLTEQTPPRSQEGTDSGASMNLKDINATKLLSDLRRSGICKEMVRALESCLHCMDPHLDGEGYKFLVDVFLLKDLAQQGSEKEFQLGALRILNMCLDCSQKDAVPWHKILEPCLSSLSVHINDREVVQQFIHFLHGLGTLDKDCAVLMCCLGAQETLAKVTEKHSSGLLQVAELGAVLSSCEKYASLYKKMTISILAGCIQMVLGQIDEHRQSHQPINVPFFDVFLHNLCQGCSMEMKEDTCWERVEVSSNTHMASRLLDGNPKTYWESNGTIGSHYIRVYMHRGVVVQQMSLLVATEDSSYMPFFIIVKGGESASSINTKLSMVKVPPLANRVILLENVSHFWPVIQICIKRCRQGGIDTRVHGLEVLGPKPTFWPIFKEQLCRRTFLFYTNKAHTWCQEISEDRMQLLLLFNRLNSALRHEQVFVDRFLPDDETAQALGKTCWEALITPLVQSITSPDPSGVSPLSWLLTHYLENLKAARSTKGWAAVFNSRVRHLSHLLVHVDSSSPEPEELKPPVKSNGKNGKNKESSSGAVKAATKKPSSTTGITQCWKGVVQQQVQRFLESSWQALDFVERYCNTYLCLRTAMEELFGQQMSFMLALCHGFSGGLLQLSFLTAMHVSEQFARYIDRWIQESWADSGNVETLQRLQQSLEPILFLAGLELANTFEHFYRYYLGDRLLSQGKTWLESAVVEHIGLCFPNRFPQQMLKNLSELEEQQQQFHLFQLQQLDKHLLELDQKGNWKEEGEEEAMEDLPFCPEEEVEVKVLALSPRCWTISPLCYLEEPGRFFPPSLSQRLVKFADFYTQSQSRFGLEHTKPRRLQWTWLGHAELEYEGRILHVSTLQMYILLCFNHAEEVSVETLLQATGLSPVLLSHALKPLTKENGILTQNQSVLKLNKGMLLQLSGQRLRLLPKPAFLNGELDEGICALERKRNTLCGLIPQILKEKEMHIDKLLFKVMEAYQKQESGSDLKSLSAGSCSSADILACVQHLLHQGSIQWRESCPQLLEHVPAEPPTPALQKDQPPIAFQTVQIKKPPSVPCVEKRQTFSTFR